MPIKTVKGNLITLAKEGKFDVIMHGCNCFHAMGAGIAYCIAKEFPEALGADKKTLYGKRDKLGKYSYGITKNGLMIVNLYTQFHPGPDFQLNNLSKALNKFVAQFGELQYKIGLPMIGAGIGGGDWNEISKVIEKEMSSQDVTIVEFGK